MDLSSENFNEHTDCVMVGHLWAQCDCSDDCWFFVCDECGEDQE